MKAWKLLPALCLGFIITPLFAKELKVIQVEEISYIKIENEDEEETYWDNVGIFGSIRGGIDYAKVGGKSSKVLLDEGALPNNYVPDDKWHTAGMTGVLVGFEFPMEEELRWQTGLSYYYSGNFEVEGVVQFASEERYTFLNYNYKVQNQRIMWENKLLSEFNDTYLIYFMAGIGGSSNKAFDYSENNALEPAVSTNPPFGEKSTTSFSYSFGFGLEAVLTEDLRFGVGYQYSDLGKVQLGNFDRQTTDEKLTVNHSPTQEVFLSLTYFFKD